VNTVYFWNSLLQGFREIRRVLAPEGRLVVGFLPKEWMDPMALPADIFTSRTVEDLLCAVEEAGLRNVRIQRPETTTSWATLVASG